MNRHPPLEEATVMMRKRLERASRGYAANPCDYTEACMHEACFAYLDILHLGGGQPPPSLPPDSAGTAELAVFLTTQRETFGGNL